MREEDERRVTADEMKTYESVLFVTGIKVRVKISY